MASSSLSFINEGNGSFPAQIMCSTSPSSISTFHLISNLLFSLFLFFFFFSLSSSLFVLVFCWRGAGCRRRSQSINEWKYDVFISFRGIDTRSGFTGSLHRALRGKEIKSFMDDQDLEKGSEINPALDEAIQNSMIALVILSKNYASSTFCLDELGKIIDCSKDKGMFVLPVFYEVDPSDVRHQKGEYRDALNKHEARNIEKERIEKWRVALTKIANLSGWHFNHYMYEHELIDIIVQDIINKIHSWREGEKDKIICNGDDKYFTQHDKPEKEKENEKEKDNKPKEKESLVTTLDLKLALHCQGYSEKITRVVTKTEGVHNMSIDKEKDTICVKGIMDVKALGGDLENKMKKKVEVVAPKKEKDNDNEGDGEGDDDTEGGAGGGGKEEEKDNDKEGEGGGDKEGGGGGKEKNKGGGGGEMEQGKMEHLRSRLSDFGMPPKKEKYNDKECEGGGDKEGGGGKEKEKDNDKEGEGKGDKEGGRGGKEKNKGDGDGGGGGEMEQGKMEYLAPPAISFTPIYSENYYLHAPQINPLSSQPNKETEKEKEKEKEIEKEKDNKPKEKESPVTTLDLKLALHCQGCIEMITKVVSRTEGVHNMSIDKEKDTICVKGIMDVKALVGNLENKMKKKVEVVAPKKEKDNDNEGGGEGDDDTEGGGGGGKEEEKDNDKEGEGGGDKEGGGGGKEKNKGGGGGGEMEQGKMEHLRSRLSDFGMPKSLIFSDKNPNALLCQVGMDCLTLILRTYM